MNGGEHWGCHAHPAVPAELCAPQTFMARRGGTVKRAYGARAEKESRRGEYSETEPSTCTKGSRMRGYRRGVASGGPGSVHGGAGRPQRREETGDGASHD